MVALGTHVWVRVFGDGDHVHLVRVVEEVGYGQSWEGATVCGTDGTVTVVAGHGEVVKARAGGRELCNGCLGAARRL